MPVRRLHVCFLPDPAAAVRKVSRRQRLCANAYAAASSGRLKLPEAETPLVVFAYCDRVLICAVGAFWALYQID